jgi:hypothetical protein
MRKKLILSVIGTCVAIAALATMPARAEQKCPATTWWNPTAQCYYPPDDPCTEIETICAHLPYLPPSCEWCTVWTLNTCTNTREEYVSWLSCPF